jgi:hypothetical protein
MIIDRKVHDVVPSIRYLSLFLRLCKSTRFDGSWWLGILSYIFTPLHCICRQIHCFSRIPFGCCERCSQGLMMALCLIAPTWIQITKPNITLRVKHAQDIGPLEWFGVEAVQSTPQMIINQHCPLVAPQLCLMKLVCRGTWMSCIPLFNTLLMLLV